MPIHKWKDRNGKTRVFLSKQWPDGSRIRRVQPNMTVARKTAGRVEESIAMGTWPQLREELFSQNHADDPTISEFADRYLQEYCLVRNRRPDFKRQALTPIKRILGNVKVKDFTRNHAREFIAARLKVVSEATVNRGVAVLKNLLSFAVDVDLIDTHPLNRFRMLPEVERGLRIMTYAEYRNLVEAVTAEDEVIGAYVAVLGETGMRKSEGLRLKWDDIQMVDRRVTIHGPTKSGKARYVPLSEFALENLRSLIRVVGCPWVFVRVQDQKPWKDPRGPFLKGREQAKLGWVRGFHDLRHFRATQWLINDVDIRTVQELLGHRDIQTTMRYVHYVQKSARKSVRNAEKLETQEWAKSFSQLDDSWTIKR